MVSLLLLLGSSALPAERIFADTCLEQESGDIAGHIVAIRQGDPAIVHFSWSEGALMAPVPTVATKGPGGKWVFVAKTASGPFAFQGKLQGHALIGSLKEPWAPRAKNVVLDERTSSAANSPTVACRALR